MTYGVIGLGNMGAAILRGMKKSGKFENDTIIGFDSYAPLMSALAEELGLVPAETAVEAARKADVLLLSVKPQILPEVMPLIADAIEPGKTVISIAAGKPTEFYEGYLMKNVGVVRVMPNINAKVLAAVSAVCGGAYASEADVEATKKIFSTVGTVVELPEKFFSAFCALSGSGVAFVYTFINALADAGVREGISKKLALEIAAGVTLGSAIMVAETGTHPAVLTDQVCSPGGTTIEGVSALKRLGFEYAVQQAVEAVVEKDRAL